MSTYGAATYDRSAARVRANASGTSQPPQHATEPGTYLIPHAAFVVHEGAVGTSEEYLTVGEVAAMLKLSPKRVRNMMSSGRFLPGEHFFRRPGIGPWFLRSRLDAWLRDADRVSVDAIPMARSAGGGLGRRARSASA